MWNVGLWQTSLHFRMDSSEMIASGRVSVCRRPRMAANLKYVTNSGPAIVLKLGALADKDPVTGRPVGMNFMADAREATLTSARVSGCQPPNFSRL